MMNRKKMKIALLSMFIFSVLVFVQTQSVLADEVENGISTEGLITLIERLETDGAFMNNTAPRALKTHLTAIGHYEKQGDMDKAIQHMGSFPLLLDHQLDNGELSADAHQSLVAYADSLLTILKGDPLAIVSHGQAHGVVIKPTENSSAINEAVDAMIDYVERATGVSLPVYTIDEWDELPVDPTIITIRIGEGSYTANSEIANEVNELHPDGFIVAPNRNQLIITSPTPVGTRNGVYGFLEEHVGVTWLFPGEEWTHVPQLDELLMPREQWQDEPTAFTLRRTMNMGSRARFGDTRFDWQKQNRTISASEIQLGHNMFNIFPVEKYGDTTKYPNFYPNNTPPEPGETHGWQPVYSNPATAAAAIDHIKNYFRNNPQAISFSLAVNDSDGFAESDPSHELYPNKMNSVGRQHMSEIYYKWVNDVVEGVTEEFPDKWFGVYAYYAVQDAPEFELHPQVIPVITKDRLTWLDSDVEAQGKSHQAAWSEKASQIGWYDYMLSGHYPLPRVYPHLVGELYEYAIDTNVEVHHWDMHPVLGDGPQPWLIAKLGWSMETDADTLLDHWYETAVGPDASNDLKQYFELWENFWRTEATETSWFNGSKHDTYMSRRDNSYLALAHDEIIQSRQLLESVLEKAQTPEQKTRAEQLLHQFEYYEASALSYPQPIEKPTSDDDVLAILDDLENTLDNRIEMISRRPEIIEELNQNPSTMYGSDPFQFGEVWSGWNADEFWHLKNYLDDIDDPNNVIIQQLSEFKQDVSKPKLREFAFLLDAVNSGLSLGEDVSFEEPGIPTWTKWNPGGSTIIDVTDEEAYTGSSSVRFENAFQAGVWKYIDVKPGLLASTVQFFTPEHTTSDGTVRIVIELYAGSDKIVYFSDAMRLADHAGEWTEVTLFEEFPEQINGKDVERILINTQVLNAQDAIVYLDDMMVYQVEYGVSGLISLVHYLAEEGELTEEQAQSMLDILEAAENQYQENEIEVYIGLLIDFIEEAKLLEMDILIEEAVKLIDEQVGFHLSTQELHAMYSGELSIPVTIKNNHDESMEFQLSSAVTDGIQLEFNHPIIVSANESLTVDGTVIIPSGLDEGEYFVEIDLVLDGVVVSTSILKIVYQSNLLLNPSFEELNPNNPSLPLHWFPSGRVQTEHSDEQAYDGNYSLKLLPDQESYREARSSNVNVIPGKTYRLSGWVYSENSQARFGLRQVNAQNGTITYTYTPVSISSPDWQYLEMQITPMQQTVVLQAYLRIHQRTEAPVWFDNMKLEIIN